MGTIQHKTIIVTGSNFKPENKLTKAHKKATKLFPDLVSPRIKSLTNGYESFLIAPCGSKLGWETDSDHDLAIEKFIGYLNSLKYEDGSTSVEYVYISFGELGTKLERHS
jgi:hypothetical protein